MSQWNPRETWVEYAVILAALALSIIITVWLLGPMLSARLSIGALEPR